MKDENRKNAASEPVSDRLNSLFANSKDPIAFADVDGNLTDFNEAFELLTGYSRRELIGNKTFMEITPAKYGAREGKKVAKILETGIPQEYEKEYIRKDGSTIPVLLNIFRVEGKDGKVIGSGVIIKDFSERKDSDAALAKSYRALSAIDEGSSDLIFIKDLDGRYELANPALLDFFGRSETEVIGKRDSELFSEAEAESIAALDRKIIESGRLSSFSEKIGGRDFLTRKWPLRDENNEIIGLIGIAHDTADERQAVQALRASEEQFRRLISGVKDHAMYLVDQEGLIINWNAGAERMTGYKAAEIIGWHFSIFFSDEDINAGVPRREIRQAIEEGSCEERGRRIRKDGTTFWADIVMTAMFDKDRQLQGFSRIVHDISDRRRSDERAENLARFPSENPFPVLRIAADGRILYANNSAMPLLDDWKTSIGGLVPGEWQKMTADLLSKNVVEKGIEIESRGRVLTFSAVPVPEVGYVNCYGADITERQEAEDQLKQGKELSEALNEISASITAAADLTELYEQVVRRAAEATGCESVGIMVGSEGAWNLESAVGPLPLEALRRPVTGARARPLDLAAKTRRAIVVRRALADARADHDWMEEMGVKSFALAPLIAEREVFGILAFHYHATETEFTANQIDFVEKLAASVSLSIQNLKNSAAKEMALADAQALRRLSDRVSQTLDIDAILELALAEAMRAVKIDHGCIYTFDQNRDLVIRTHKRLSAEFLEAKSKIGPGEGCAGQAASENKVFSPGARQHDFVCQDSKILLGLDCLAAIPITVTGTTLGVLELFAPIHRRLSARERDVLVTMANQVAPALENANLYAAERHIANTLQEVLLTVPERISGLSFGHLYRSAAVEVGRAGGDFYDLFELEDDNVGVVLGDVSGKGLQAASLAALVKNAIKAYAYQHDSPAKVLALANEIVLRGATPSTFVTVFFGIINKRSGVIEYCSAGHPPALIKKETGETIALKTNSPAIGILPDLEFLDDQDVLGGRDMLLLYTDGLIEARCAEGLFGEERLIELVHDLAPADPEAIPNSVFNEIWKSAGCRLHDDVAVLSICLEERAHERDSKKAA